jgi:hypothetical protein
MRKLMDGVFARYGVDAMITTQTGQQKVKVFFHSVNSRSWQNMERMFFPLGEIHRGQYICVLPIAAAATAGDTVTVNGKSYKLRRVEEMFFKGGSIYRWGLCVEKGGDDDWGSRG